MLDHPWKQSEVAEARKLINQTTFKTYTLSEEDVADLWSKIRHSNNVRAVNAAPVFRRWMSVAASVVIIASAALFYTFWQSESYLEYHTAYGETKSIVLPDSSTVILNSNSTLRFSNTWNEAAIREIELEGEAFFSVTHTVDHKPFRVKTDEGLHVDVLGTTFNVYHRVKETKVVLNTGKIRLQLPTASPTQNITMQPGDFVEYKEKTFSRKVVDPAVYTAWTQKKIILDHTSLREMISLLHDNYGVIVEVANDSLLNQTVSGSMPLLEVDAIIDHTAQVFQLKVMKKKNKYLMYE
jgi:transmembrane sensor